MQEIVELITDNGISVICVAFMIYFINTTMKDLQNTLVEINKSLITLSTRVEALEERTK